MLKSIRLGLVLGLSLLLYACVYSEQSGNQLSIDSSVFDNQARAFVSHRGEGKYSSYLMQDINYLPVQQLFEQLEVRLQRSLKSRGEAHITTITPVEYFQVLKPYLSIAQVEAIALKANIQAADFTVVCVGRGEVKTAQRVMHTYYVVVESEALLRIRRQIFQAFVDNGGDKKAFDPDKFYPHITLGFTDRDLHLSDGVVKDKTSCHYPLVVKSV